MLGETRSDNQNKIRNNEIKENTIRSYIDHETNTDIHYENLNDMNNEMKNNTSLSTKKELLRDIMISENDQYRSNLNQMYHKLEESFLRHSMEIETLLDSLREELKTDLLPNQILRRKEQEIDNISISKNLENESILMGSNVTRIKNIQQNATATYSSSLLEPQDSHDDVIVYGASSSIDTIAKFLSSHKILVCITYIILQILLIIIGRNEKISVGSWLEDIVSIK